MLIDSERPSRILGYYSLSAASLAFERLTETDRKGYPRTQYRLCGSQSRQRYLPLGAE